MLYLDYAVYDQDLLIEKENKYPFLIRKIIIFYRKNIKQVFRYNLNNNKVIVISKISKKTLNKLNKVFKVDVVKRVCLCDKLLENTIFLDYIKSRDIRIMDGKWLFQFMLKDTIMYICKQTNEDCENQEISILANKNSFFISDTIQRISGIVKNINVITNDLTSFKELKDAEFNESGIILNISNNYKKIAMKSNIIVNFDFNQNQINKIKLPLNANVLNINENIVIEQKNFVGNIIDTVIISLPVKYKEIYKKLHNFNSSILYESLIYKNTLYKNIWSEITLDNVEIIALENNYRYIKFSRVLNKNFNPKI